MKLENEHYEVLGFGVEKYEFSQDTNAKNSYFIKYKTKNGEENLIWGKDLQRVVKENNLQIGEFAKFKFIGKESVVVQIEEEVDGQRVVNNKEVYRNSWDCSVLGREKQWDNGNTDKKKEFIDDAKSIGNDIDKISKEATKIKQDQLAEQRKFVSLESDNMTKHFANMLKELEQNIAKFFELLKILLLAQDEEKKVQNSQNTNINNINPDPLKALMSDEKFLAYVKQRSEELEREITAKINILFAENTGVADELVYKFQEYKNEEKIDDAKVTSFIDMLNKKYDENISKKIVVEVEDETLNNDKHDMAQEKNEEKITILKQQKHRIQK